MRLFFFVHSFLPCPRLYWLKINTSNEVDHLPNMEYVFRPRIPYNLMKLCKSLEHFRKNYLDKNYLLHHISFCAINYCSSMPYQFLIALTKGV